MVDPWSSYNAPGLESIVVFIGVSDSQLVRIVYHRAVPASLRLGGVWILVSSEATCNEQMLA